MYIPVCRVCLGGVQMQRVEDSRLIDTYETLTGTKLTAQDGRPSALCSMCYSQLRKCWRFSNTARRSEMFLTDLLQNDVKISRETIASLNFRTTPSLSLTTVRTASFEGYSDTGLKLEVKQEATTDTPKLERTELDLKTDIDNANVYYFYCDMCYRTSMTKTELIAHLETHTTPNKARNNESERHKVKQTRCKVCNKMFSEPKALKLHLSIHTGAKPFPCLECSQAFRLKQSLQNHVTVHHTGEKNFVCDACSKSFFHKKGLIAHYKSTKCHSPSYKPYACKICNSTFSDIDSLKRHKRSHVGERRYSCKRCDKEFTVKSYLNKHTSQVHSAELPFSCPKCSKQFKQSSTLKIHMRIHSDKMLNCPVCGKRFLHNSSLKRHARRHSGRVKQTDEWHYCCDRCSRTFKSQASLNAHLRTHTGEQPYTCDTCGKKFSQKGNLQLHLKIHFGEKTFACEICGKTFLLKCQLKIHYQVHSEEKPYSCGRCEMMFTFKSALKEHVRRLHTEVKPFACNKCGKSFDQECSLKRHTRCHTAERLYSCKKCTKSYTTSENLKRHIAIHSDETPYQCDRCNKSFKIMRYLQQHKMTARCRARAIRMVDSVPNLDVT